MARTAGSLEAAASGSRAAHRMATALDSQLSLSRSAPSGQHAPVEGMEREGWGRAEGMEREGWGTPEGLDLPAAPPSRYKGCRVFITKGNK